MNAEQMRQIFQDTDYVHASGSPEELRAAEYLKAQCEARGLQAWLEPFPVPMGEIQEARVWADDRELPCRGFFCCGSGQVEGELYYMPNQDPVAMAGAKDKIVLLDSSGVGYFTYQDLMKAGAKGILFQYAISTIPTGTSTSGTCGPPWWGRTGRSSAPCSTRKPRWS